jgi:hypothetical protein
MKVLLNLHPMDPDWRAMQPVIEKDTALRSDLTLVVSDGEAGAPTCAIVLGQQLVATHSANCGGMEKKRQLLNFLTANFAA